MAAMPVAITPFVLSEIYDLDKKIVVTSIIISTILSIISIPMIIYLL
jgi:predicted permease